MRLGRFFSWAEIESSETARRRDISNTIPDELRPAVRALVAELLDPLRTLLGRPIRITSGYRSPELNSAIGGSATSQHMRGEAVDGFSTLPSREVVELLAASGLPFTQAIWYAPERGGHFHLSYSAADIRREVLYAKPGGGYETRGGYDETARRPQGRTCPHCNGALDLDDVPSAG